MSLCKQSRLSLFPERNRFCLPFPENQALSPAQASFLSLTKHLLKNSSHMYIHVQHILHTDTIQHQPVKGRAGIQGHKPALHQHVIQTLVQFFKGSSLEGSASISSSGPESVARNSKINVFLVTSVSRDFIFANTASSGHPSLTFF